MQILYDILKSLDKIFENCRNLYNIYNCKFHNQTPYAKTKSNKGKPFVLETSMFFLQQNYTLG